MLVDDDLDGGGVLELDVAHDLQQPAVVFLHDCDAVSARDQLIGDMALDRRDGSVLADGDQPTTTAEAAAAANDGGGGGGGGGGEDVDDGVGGSRRNIRRAPTRRCQTVASGS